LDKFSAAIGLDINFHKSTFIPIKTDAAAASLMACAFGCEVSSFPHTYLGLPLSTQKLRFSNFVPFISKGDDHLSEWRGRSLPIGSRLILINSIQSSLLSHAMSVGLLLVGVADTFDKWRRAFFSTGEESCSGVTAK
jgi:hypothetical protein